LVTVKLMPFWEPKIRKWRDFFLETENQERVTREIRRAGFAWGAVRGSHERGGRSSLVEAWNSPWPHDRGEAF